MRVARYKKSCSDECKNQVVRVKYARTIDACDRILLLNVNVD